MQASRATVWVCCAIAALGAAVLPVVFAFGVQWLCLWLGLACFFEGARRRFPRFEPLPAPASLQSLGMGNHEVEGPLLVPWYLLLLIGTTWACTMLVPLLAPSSGALPVFGIAIALVLTGGAYWLFVRQRASATIAAILTHPSTDDRTIAKAVVAKPETALSRHIHWFQIVTTRTSTQRVTTANGTSVDVTTASPNSTTYGFCQEQRNALVLRSDDGPVTLDTTHLRWSASRHLLPTAPSLRGIDPSTPRGIMINAYVGRARVWEQEFIGQDHNVIVAGSWNPTQRRFSGTKTAPTLVFGVAPDQDPLTTLRHHLRLRRLPIAAQLLLAILAVTVAFTSAPPEPEAPQLRQLPVSQ